MPFCNFRITADKPKSSAYPKKLVTLGDHIRKCRLDLGLTQKDMTQIFGIGRSTIQKWEANECSPMCGYYPKIFEFIGYNPLPTPKSLIERLRYYRLSHGISYVQIAKALNVCALTVYEWERGLRNPSHALCEKISQWILEMNLDKEQKYTNVH